MPDDAFESPDTDGDNDYEIVVEVSDGLDENGSAENPAVVDNSINVSVTVHQRRRDAGGPRRGG